jgi:DNA-binding NarL/FixJ family response regulator
MFQGSNEAATLNRLDRSIECPGPSMAQPAGRRFAAMRRILIADQHSIARLGVRTLLETRPNLEIVGEAATGREALSIALATRPDIAVLDYSLPDLNGADLTLKLKKELPQTQVLILTMHHREEMILDVLRAGARGFMLKSDPEQQLLAAIDALSLRRPYFSSAISETMLAQHLRGKAQLTPGTLTHREREVVQLIAEGKINKQIAHVLDISIKTVETHRSTAMQKLKLRSTAELVRYALRNNIVGP